MSNLAKLIHDRRVAAGKTLEEVGTAVGVSKATIQRWESGMIRNMGVDKVIPLANALELDVAEMIEALRRDV